MKENKETGAFEVQLSEKQRKAYFPNQGSPRREVSPEEMAKAERWWQEAEERGRQRWPEILNEVHEVLGTRQLAVLTETKSARTVQKWLEEKQNPLPFKKKRIVQAYRIIEAMLEKESPDTVRAWFMGMNPNLEDKSPLLTLGEDYESVVWAARSFLAHG